MKRTIAIGGGKGGVGQTLIAANLSIAMAQYGRRVVLVDADLGGANLHTLFGIQHPRYRLEDFVDRRIGNLMDAVTETHQPNLGVICGGMPVPGSANPKHAQKRRLISQLKKLEADTVVLDIGSTVTLAALDFFNTASIKTIVLTPQLTSLHNGYGFLKAAVFRYLQQQLPTKLRPILTAGVSESSSKPLNEIVTTLAEADAEAAEQCRRKLREYDVYVMGNMLRAQNEFSVFASIGNVIQFHLQLDVPIVGALWYSDKLQKSINERFPYMYYAGLEKNAEQFRKMAAALLSASLPRLSTVPAADPLLSPGAPISPSHDRKDPRYPVNWKVVLRQGKTRIRGTMCNIAFGGTLVDLRDAIGTASDDPFWLTITPSESGTAATFRVQLRHQDDGGNLVGFAFRETDGTAGELLKSLVAKAATEIAVNTKSD